MAVSLTLERTADRCRERTWGFGPACGAFLLKPSLSTDAVNELLKKGQPVPPLDPVCLNPVSGCAIKARDKIGLLMGLMLP